jgi:hypothetical protein
MRTQAQSDGFEASSGIFPLLWAMALSVPSAMQAVMANALIQRTLRTQVARTVSAGNDIISSCSLPKTAASFCGLVGLILEQFSIGLNVIAGIAGARHKGT